MTTFKQISDSYCFIDWLVMTADKADLVWRNELGMVTYLTPQDGLLDDAAEDLYGAWCELSWADQRFCIVEAADQLTEIEIFSIQNEMVLVAS